MNIKEEMKMMIAELNYHTMLYDKGTPKWSDKEWDEHYFRLAELEKNSGVILPNSPTQKINYQVVSKLNKVEHSHPMLSLEKTKEIEEIKSFLGERDYIAMLKMDGLTCSLRYENGRLVSAETRGNGVIGEDITHNAFVVRNIPKVIKDKRTIIIDGEMICTYKDFERFSDEYKNPRNFASGSIRLLDSKECEKRCLSFIAWDCIAGLEEETVGGKLTHLLELGFDIVPFIRSPFMFSENFGVDTLKDIAAEKGYPIDGLVFKFDDVAYGESLGRTEHHFKNAMAFKFYDEEYETELLNIDYDVSRKGILTPVAVFKPIDVDGTVIERASLHNYSIMKELLGRYPDLYQPIKVAKMNEIIPQVVSAEYKNNQLHDHIIFDSMNCRCPVCGTLAEISVSNSGVETLFCPNEQCEGKLINVIDHFVGKRGLDVKGLSKATIEKLIDWGWVSRRADIFTLYEYKSEWQNMSGFGVKSVSNILEAISTAKNTHFDAYLSALGIPLIGRAVSKEISKEFRSYNDFREAIKGGFDFSSIPGFGYEMNKSLTTYDYTEADEIAEMLCFEEVVEEQVAADSAIKDKTFCITGKSSYGSRDKVKAMIEAAGGKVTGSVTSKTDYLLCNTPENTAKYNNAVKFGTKIINDKELGELLR